MQSNQQPIRNGNAGGQVTSTTAKLYRSPFVFHPPPVEPFLSTFPNYPFLTNSNKLPKTAPSATKPTSKSILLDTVESTSDDELLNDIISGPSNERSVIAVLAKRVLAVNQATIEARAAKHANQIQAPIKAFSSNPRPSRSSQENSAPHHSSSSDRHNKRTRSSSHREALREREEQKEKIEGEQKDCPDDDESAHKKLRTTSNNARSSSPRVLSPRQPSSHHQSLSPHSSAQPIPPPPTTEADAPMRAELYDASDAEPSRASTAAPFFPPPSDHIPPQPATQAFNMPSFGLPRSSPGGPLSPSVLHHRAVQELRLLDTLSESKAKVESLAHAHSLSLLQSETEKLAQMIQEKEAARAADEAKQAAARAEFIARTHAVDAQREQEKQTAIQERERFKEALHAAQLHATQQQALLAQELERTKAIAAQAAQDVEHKLELERVKARASLDAETEANRRVREAQDNAAKELRERERDAERRVREAEEQERIRAREMQAALEKAVERRENQHAQALEIALEQLRSGSAQFNSIKELADAAVEGQKAQAAQMAGLSESVGRQLQAASDREERALEQLAKQQHAATAAAAVAAASVSQPKGPIQVQLLGLNGLLVAGSQQTAGPSSHALPLPVSSPALPRRAPATDRRHLASLSHYSDDFDLNGLAAESAAAGAAGGEEDVEEEYADDFASKPPTPKASARQFPGGKTPSKSPMPSHGRLSSRSSNGAPHHVAGSSIDESIQFDDGVEEAAAPHQQLPFHIQASPIPKQRGRGQEEDIEIEIEEDSAVAGASASFAPSKRGGAMGGSAATIGEEFEIEDEVGEAAPPSSSYPPAHQQGDASQVDYSADFVNETNGESQYQDASFIPEEGSQQFRQQPQRQPKQTQPKYQPQPQQQQQPYQQQEQWTEEHQYDDVAPTDTTAHAPAVPDSPTPLLQSIDTLLNQQLALLAQRYEELQSSTKSQLSVLHRESSTNGWSERETDRRKVHIKSRFNSEKGQIATQRALLQTMAQQQKLRIYQQHQELTAARFESERWASKLEKIELGPSSIAGTPKKSRSIGGASRRSQSAKPSGDEETEISFEEEKQPAAVPSSRSKSASTRPTPKYVRPQSASSSYDSAGFTSAGASYTSVGADEFSTEEDGARVNPDRDRLLALQNELHTVRQQRRKQESDPTTRSLIRQERRLAATEELAAKLLKEKAEILANQQREVRIAKRRKEVARLLKEVEALERGEESPVHDGLRSPTTPRPPSSSRSYSRRSPRIPTTSLSPSRSATPRAAAGGPSTTVTPRAGGAEEEVEIEFSEGEAKPVSPLKRRASPRQTMTTISVPAGVNKAKAPAATAGAESEEVAISFDEGSDVGASASQSRLQPHTPHSRPTSAGSARQPSPRQQVSTLKTASTEEDIEVEFEDEQALAAVPTPKSAIRTVAASGISKRVQSSGDESIEIEDDVAGAQVPTESSAHEVEEDVVIQTSTAASAAEIETEAEHSQSYTDSFDKGASSHVEENIEIEEDETPKDQSIKSQTYTPLDQSNEYMSEEFTAPSPLVTHKRLDKRGSQESVVEEDLMNLSANASDYQNDSFAAGASSVSVAKHSTDAAGVTVPAGPAEADISIAEEKNFSVSEHYDDGSFVASHPEVQTDASAAQVPPKPLSSRVSPSASASAEILADASNYSDSFADASASNVGAAQPPVASPAPPISPVSASAENLSMSVAEELSQPASAAQSLTQEQIEAASKSASSSRPVTPPPPTISVTSPTEAPKSPVVIQTVKSPANLTVPIEEEVEEEDSASLTGEEYNSSYDAIIVSPKAPARSITLEEKELVLEMGPEAGITFTKEPSSLPSPRKSPQSKLQHLAALEAAAREAQDEAATSASSLDEKKEAKVDISTMSKDELANAITMSLLQDLTQELKEESSTLKRQKDRSSPSKDHGVADKLEQDLLNDSLQEAERIAELKRDRSRNGAPESPDSEISLIGDYPSSNSSIESPALQPISSAGSPLGLMNSKLASQSPAEWSLDQPPEPAEAEPELPSTSTIKSADELNRAVESEMERLKTIEAEKAAPLTLLQQSKAYVTELLSTAIELARRHHQETASEEEKATPGGVLFIPTIKEPVVSEAESQLDLRNAAPSEAAFKEQQGFNRLLCATANQYIESYNRSILEAEFSVAPWLASSATLSQQYNHPGADGSPAAMTLPLSHNRIRRAPGGLILSLKKGGADDFQADSHDQALDAADKWCANITHKVWKKVHGMSSTAKHMSQALSDAIANAKIPAAAAPEVVMTESGTVTESPAAPRIHMQLVLENEVALVNSILAKQMQSVEPGPAGATMRVWKQQRGTAGATSAPLSLMGHVNPLLDLSTAAVDSSLDQSSADSSHSSILYSGSECDWEGGYEASESAHVVADIADYLVGKLLEEVVQANMAIEDKKYTRKLIARATARENIRAKQIQVATSSSTLSLQVGASASPVTGESNEQGSPRSPQLESPADRKKARRQAIKL